MSLSHGGADRSSIDILSSDVGIVDDSWILVRSYCDEWWYGVSRIQGFALRDEVRELQHRINVWKAGEQKLDQRLARAPPVREAVLRILMPCIWELRQGDLCFETTVFRC